MNFNETRYQTKITGMEYNNQQYETKKYNNEIMTRLMHYEITPLGQAYFSGSNIRYLQEQIKLNINKILGCNRKYGQTEADLVVSMIQLFQMFALNKNTNILAQLKVLNKQTLKYILPDMITELKQEIGYLRDISRPLDMIPLPINVNCKGRKVLPLTKRLGSLTINQR